VLGKWEIYGSPVGTAEVLTQTLQASVSATQNMKSRLQPAPLSTGEATAGPSAALRSGRDDNVRGFGLGRAGLQASVSATQNMKGRLQPAALSTSEATAGPSTALRSGRDDKREGTSRRRT
jgi:hypothetical protein